MPSNNPALERFLHAAADAVGRHADEVAALDQAIGDGDHVTNLLRGLEALRLGVSQWEPLDWPATLQKVGMTLMSTIGGASGSLYGTLFIAMSKAMRDKALSAAAWAEAFAQGVEAVKQRGRSDLGEKTMLDVLIPVARAWQDAVERRQETETMRYAIDQAAESGCESTRDMVAGKGRASFLGERSRGHLDPGARSSQLMIQAITRAIDDGI